VRLLNPHVSVSALTLSLQEIANSFDQYHLVCISGYTPEEILFANKMARKASTYFFNVDSFGYFGYMFEDIGLNYEFEFESDSSSNTKEKSSIDTVELSSAINANVSSPLFVLMKGLFRFWEKHSRYPSGDVVFDTEEFLAMKNNILLENKASNRERTRVPDKLANNFLQHLGTELSPVCAIVGGVVAQEILKVVCHNDKPFNNSFFFNGLDDSGVTCKLI